MLRFATCNANKRGHSPTVVYPSRKDMLLPLLRGIEDGRKYTTGDLEGILKEHFGLTQADLSPEAGRVRYELGWVKTYLTKVALARYPGHGLLEITENGRRLLDCKSCPDRICKKCIDALNIDPNLVDERYLGAL